MIKQIHKWRAKPEGARKRMHIFATVLIMAVIVAGWAVVVSNRISVAVSGKNEANTASPFAVFKDDLTANVEQIRDGYYMLKGDKK